MAAEKEASGNTAITIPSQKVQPTYYYIMGCVDEDGFFVPIEWYYKLSRGDSLPGQPESTLRDIAEARLGGSTALFGKTRYYLLAHGEMEPWLYDEMKKAISSSYQQNEEYPPIPAWLGEHPPYQTVFLPNGEILCYGELDLHFEPNQANSMIAITGSSFNYRETNWPPKLAWYRYSADGELLDQHVVATETTDSNWQVLFYNHLIGNSMYAPVILNSDSSPYVAYIKGIQIEFNRIINQTDLSSISTAAQIEVKIKAATDWKGNPLDLDSPTIFEPSYYLNAISREALQKEYDKQVKDDVVNPATPSPFQGEPNGPQVVDATPRPMPLYAESLMGGQTRYVLVQPTGDPANPYIDQYTPWDLWLHTRINMNYYNDPDIVEAALKPRNDAIKAAEESGDAKALEAAKSMRFNIVPPDRWCSYNLSVSPEGFILPYLDKDVQRTPYDSGYWGATPRECFANYCSVCFKSIDNSSTPQFRISASGEMPVQIEELYKSAKWDAHAWQYPEIPKWLLNDHCNQTSSLRVCFLKNGGYTVSGMEIVSPGMIDPDGSVSDTKINGNIKYYSSNGYLKDELVYDISDYKNMPCYLDLVFPDYRDKLDQAKAEGKSLVEIPNTCILLLDSELPFNRPVLELTEDKLPNIIEAYTLDGKPIGIDETIPGIQLAVTLTTKMIKEIYDAQQRVPKTKLNEQVY